MTDSTTTPKSQETRPLSGAEVRAQRRVQSSLQAQIVEAARARVPNITTSAELPAVVARKQLKLARKQYASGANRFLNRATRRALAREVGLS